MIIDKEKLMNVMSVHDPKEKSGAEHKYWLIVGGGDTCVGSEDQVTYIYKQVVECVCVCVCVWGGSTIRQSRDLLTASSS